MTMRHAAVWDDMGDAAFGFPRQLPRAGRGQPQNGSAVSGRRSITHPTPSPFLAEPVEVKLSMGLNDLIGKKGMGSNALLGSGIDVSALATQEPRGSRYQRLARVPSYAGKLNGALPPTARSVEHLTLTAELYTLEQEGARREQVERQQAFKLRQATADAQRLRLQLEKLLAERDHPTRNTDRQRQYMREHVQKLRDKHDTMVRAIAERAAAGTDALDSDVLAFVAEQSSACERQHEPVQALIDKVNKHLRGPRAAEGGEGDEPSAEGALLTSGQVVLFGSRATRLSLASSDVDLVLQGELTEAEQRAGGARAVIMRLVELLRVDHPEIKFIDALIPRCTFVDHASGLTADITAGPALLHRPGSAPLQHSGEIASAYVRDLIGQYAPLRPLVLILKALLRRAHYHEPFIGGLSSHGLVMMVGTMLRVREIESGSDALHATPLSVLLCEFLFVFGFEFDYAKYGISLKRGEFFDRLNLGDFAAPLLVEDPLAEAPEDGTVVNVTHVVTSTQMLQGIFRSAYSLLTARTPVSLSVMASLD